MIEAGEVLQNRYRIEKQIGQGGMGTVFLATDERFGSTVAIKETLLPAENFRRAFEREARLLNSLRHPALPNVSDYFIEENGQFIVMEYIAGEDLSEMMERSGKPFPLEDGLTWADQLLDALEYLHNQKIPVIHRDIKPQNLKLTPRGQIILLDFGLAKGNPTEAGTQTAAKSIFGYSRNYASLEQIQGTGTDPRSDLYSLAATVYHLLTGVPPVDALTRAMHVLSEREDPLKPVNRIDSRIPAGIGRVLHRAMALNANQRPQSAAEMREMLHEGKEDFEDFDEVVTQIRKPPVGAALLDQKTKIMGEATTPRGVNSEARTKILDTGDFESAEFERENFNNGKGARRGKAIGAALAGLLLVGTAGSALYVYNPEVFHKKENRPEKKASFVLSETKDGSSNINSAFADADAEPKKRDENINSETAKEVTEAPATTKESSPKANPVEKPVEATKNNPKPKQNKTTVVVDGEDTLYIGNMKITDDRIETEDMIVNDDGVFYKKPPKVKTFPRVQPVPGMRPPITKEEYEKLTPEQKRRLNEAMKKIQESQRWRKVPMPPPAPKPTP